MTAPVAPSLGRKVLGFGLIGLGLLGTVLPVLQGILFLALGLFVLRHEYVWARRGLERARCRWPGALERVEAMEAGLLAWCTRQGVRLRRLLRIA